MMDEAGSGQAAARRDRRVKSAPEAVTWAMIAERAYHISLSEEAGSELDNWLRAEEELLGRFRVSGRRRPRTTRPPSQES
jgi:hypothetical protein